MEYRQICYARTGVQAAGSGWQTLNVSAGVPGDAAAAFSRAQSGSVGNVAGVSPAGKLRQVRELRREGGYVFLTMLTFGVPDQRRRPSAYAHGLVFDREAFERDPQVVLRVGDGTFGYTEASTKPGDLRVELAEPLTLAEARRICGLTDEGYRNLLSCVYGSLGSGGVAGRPFEVECDCAPETLHAVLTCVYEGLPYGLRSRVSFSTLATNRGMPASVVFSERAQGHAFVLAAGEVRQGVYGQDSWRGDGQGLYPVALLPVRRGGSDTALRQLYDQLEDQVETFSRPGAASLFAYQLAFEQLEDRGVVARGSAGSRAAGPEDAQRRLSGCLALPDPGDDARRLERDRLIDYALGEVIETGAQLDDACGQSLAQALAETGLDSLKDTGFAYNVQVLSRKTPQDGAAYLDGQYADAKARSSSEFLRLRGALLAEAGQNGRDIVVAFYAGRVAGGLARRGASLAMEDVVAFRDETRGIDDARITAAYRDLCERYAMIRVRPDGDPQELVGFIRGIAGTCGLSTDEANTLWGKVLGSYWGQFSFAAYDFDDRRYKGMLGKAWPECAALQTSARLVDDARADREDLLLQDLPAYREAVVGLGAAEKRATLERRLVETLIRAHGGRSYDLDVWYYAAGYLASGESATAFLLRHNMIPAERDACEAAFECAGGLRDDGVLATMQSELERLSKEDDYLSSQAGTAARVLRGYLKRLRKEDKRAAREAQAAHGGGTGGVFGRFKRALGRDDRAGAYDAGESAFPQRGYQPYDGQYDEPRVTYGRGYGQDPYRGSGYGRADYTRNGFGQDGACGRLDRKRGKGPRGRRY